MTLKDQQKFLRHEGSPSCGLIVQALGEEMVISKDPEFSDPAYYAKFLVLTAQGRYEVVSAGIRVNPKAYMCDDWENIRDTALRTLGVTLRELKSVKGRKRGQHNVVGRVVRLDRSLADGCLYFNSFGDGATHDELAPTLAEYLRGAEPYNPSI